MKFKYEEDQEYFDKIFFNFGGITKNIHLFDFSAPDEKRKEFNKIRNKVFEQLKLTYGESCQLKCHPDCSREATAVDHLIPLSSNVLNKKLRNIKATTNKKVRTQSFGSNNFLNFVLACRRCNAFKMNKIPDDTLIHQIYSQRI